MKRRRGGRHRLSGNPARGLEWVVKQQGGRGRGRHRLPAPSLPTAGAITAGVVLLATSAAAAPATPVDTPRAPERGRAPAADHSEPAGLDGTRRLPPMYQAAGTVENIDDAGATIPTVFTGDIPAGVLDAYRQARDLINQSLPNCHLPLELLEAIGKVETGHARGGQVDNAGTTLTPILGPVLDGKGFAAIPDTDGGRLDGDVVWDRAVGPMQFIPSTWAGWFADGNGDHRADPHNVYDASLAAARYLCAANRDLGTPEGLNQAIFSYNHSASYRNLVLAWMSTYARGTVVIPDGTILDLRGSNPVRTIAAPAVPAAQPPQTAAPPPVTDPPAQPPSAEPAPSPPPTTTPPPTTEPTPPPTSTPPPTPPTSMPPPTTEPTPPPTSTPPVDPVTGLVCAVTGLVGGLLGGGGCQSPTAGA